MKRREEEVSREEMWYLKMRLDKMRKMGISVARICEAAGVSRSYLYDALKEKKKLSRRAFKKINLAMTMRLISDVKKNEVNLTRKELEDEERFLSLLTDGESAAMRMLAKRLREVSAAVDIKPRTDAVTGDWFDKFLASIYKSMALRYHPDYIEYSRLWQSVFFDTAQVFSDSLASQTHLRPKVIERRLERIAKRVASKTAFSNFFTHVSKKKSSRYIPETYYTGARVIVYLICKNLTTKFFSDYTCLRQSEEKIESLNKRAMNFMRVVDRWAKNREKHDYTVSSTAKRIKSGYHVYPRVEIAGLLSTANSFLFSLYSLCCDDREANVAIFRYLIDGICRIWSRIDPETKDTADRIIELCSNRSNGSNGSNGLNGSNNLKDVFKYLPSTYEWSPESFALVFSGILRGSDSDRGVL